MYVPTYIPTIIRPVLQTIASLILTPYFLITSTELLLAAKDRWGMHMVAQLGNLKIEEVGRYVVW